MSDDSVDLLGSSLKQNLAGRFNGGTGIGHVVNEDCNLKPESHMGSAGAARKVSLHMPLTLSLTSPTRSSIRPSLSGRSPLCLFRLMRAKSTLRRSAIVVAL
jgi:hypothetical protein